MSNLNIIVYGNGDLFREFFNAVVAVIGTNTYVTLTHLAILLAGITVTFSLVTKRDLMVCVKWLGLYYLVFCVLLAPKKTIEITDRVNGNMTYPVANVPFGLAIFASLTSQVGDALTQLLEQNFSMPEDFRYNHTGMVMASRLVTAASQFQISDPRFENNLQGFINQCVFYDLFLNKYSLNELTVAPNIWEFVMGHASPARAFLYDQEIVTCRDGAQKLNRDWSGILDKTSEQFSARMFPAFSKNKAKQLLLSYLPTSYNFLGNLAQNAQGLIQQNLMMNAIQNGVLKMNATTNAAASLESYAFVRGQEQKRLTNATLGDMAAYWLPLMKNSFEAIMYASFLFIILLGVFPFGFQVLRNYIYSLLWLQLWAPLYAIINLIVTFYAKAHTLAAIGGADSVTLQSMAGILQINADMSGLAGYLSLSVPFLAAGLTKGMASSFTQMAQYVGGVTQAAGSSAAAEATSGNFSFGNTSLGNQSAYNSSSFHTDMSGKVSTGMFTNTTEDGGLITATPSGNTIIDNHQAFSQFGTNVNSSSALRQMNSQQAERAESAAYNDSKSYAKSVSEAMRDMSDLSHHLSASASNGDAWAVSESKGATDAFNAVLRAGNDYGHRTHSSFGDSASVSNRLDAHAGVNGGIGVGNSIGANGGGNIGRSSQTGGDASHRHDYSDGQSFANDQQFTQNIDVVKRAISDHSLRATNEKGQRLLDNISASLDHAEIARHDYSSHLNEAQSYRQAASMSEEQAYQIASNNNSAYQAWLANQPGTNGQGRLGAYAAAHMDVHDPDLNRHYANQFVAENAASLKENWHGALSGSKTDIERIAHYNQSRIPSDHKLEQQYQTLKSQIHQKAFQENLHDNNFINDSAKRTYENNHADTFVNSGKKQLEEGGNALERKVKYEETHERAGNFIKNEFTGINTKEEA